MAVKPKHLVLNLLSVAEEPLTSQQFVRVGELFDITANNIRVTLARLSADKLIETCGRGQYQLGEHSRELAQNLAGWRSLEKSLVPWSGDWIGVFVATLGRADRTALRRRSRVLRLVGFEEFKQGLLVRPNNLEGGVARARERLYNLGLEQEAMVFRLGDLEQTEQKAAMELWDTNALEQQYTEGLREMESWMVRADELTPDVAARETFLIGDRILHHIVFDPLLPTEMINTQARARYIDTMARFDEVGKVHWRKIYRSLG